MSVNIKNTKNMGSKLKRLHRARKTREHIKKLGVEKGVYRLTVFRSNQHIYAQIIAPVGGNVCACASTLDTVIKTAQIEEGKVGLAKAVGQLVAERARAAGIEQVAFDRSGFKYHGRIAALVDSARANGLKV